MKNLTEDRDTIAATDHMFAPAQAFAQIREPGLHTLAVEEQH